MFLPYLSIQLMLFLLSSPRGKKENVVDKFDIRNKKTHIFQMFRNISDK